MSLELATAAELAVTVHEAFERERGRIRSSVPDADVIHTGGTSVAGALTRGDVDIHVRVASADFARSLSGLLRLYEPYKREMWTHGFAALVAHGSNPPVGIALTAIGGEHDLRFTRAWARLAAEPALLEEYNRLKRRHAGSNDDAAYEDEKAAFFSRVASTDREENAPRTTTPASG